MPDPPLQIILGLFRYIRDVGAEEYLHDAYTQNETSDLSTTTTTSKISSFKENCTKL